jgi:hypothetical protein
MSFLKNDWTFIILAGALLGLGIFGLWYFKVEPLYGWLTAIFTSISTQINNAANGLNFGEVINGYLAKPETLVMLGGVAAGGVSALYYKIKKGQAELHDAKTTIENSKLQDVIGNEAKYSESLEQKVSGLEKRIDELQSDNLPALYEEMKLKLSQAEQQKRDLNAQILGIQNTQEKFIQDLANAANNQFVPGPDGKLCKVLKITNTIIK